jgi:hypothetical protein
MMMNDNRILEVLIVAEKFKMSELCKEELKELRGTLQYFPSFQKLFLKEIFSDVDISVQGTTYSGHKAILAYSSPHFRAMFRSNFRESQEGIERLTD